MAANYVLLERVTVGAANATSVAFSNIPSTGYTDLKIVASVRTSRAYAVDALYLYFNTDTTSGNYSGKQFTGTGTSAQSNANGYANEIAYVAGNSGTSNTFGTCEFYISNYTSSNPKSVSVDSTSENAAALSYASISTYLWSGTAAINKITLAPATGPNILAGSTFSLYGIAAVGTTPAIAPYAAGGDIIQTDGTYWYHAFLSSGSFTPAKALSCDVLVVAGGGAGSGTDAGGGGAGGVIYFASQGLASLTAQTVTVGAGGTGGAAYSDGTSGTNSTFGSLTAAIGGGRGGGGSSTITGASGGSGGGGSGNTGGGSGSPGASTQTGTGATAYYGNAGGGGTATGRPGGGGGGAGAAGVTASANAAGNGGIGINTYSSWTTATGLGVSNYIASGGGGGIQSGSAGTGGTGGAGNGNAGGSGAPGSAAVVNTGSGGGGGANDSAGGNGGSGLVIIRYTV
jgi:hypothetical protein